MDIPKEFVHIEVYLDRDIDYNLFQTLGLGKMALDDVVAVAAADGKSVP